MTYTLRTLIAAAALALLSPAANSAPAYASGMQKTVEGTSSKAMKRWASAIGKTLRKEMRTPKRFETAKEFGAVTYALTVDQAGHVLSAQQTKSAGYARLDDSAAETIARMEKLPPMPADIEAQLAIVHMKLAYLPMPTSSYRQRKLRQNTTDMFDLGLQKSGVQVTLLKFQAARPQ